MPITATYNLQIGIATGRLFNFTSSGESFNVEGGSLNTFKPGTLEITRNLASKNLSISLPRVQDSSEELSRALASDTLLVDATARYSILINGVNRVLFYGRISEATFTDAEIKIKLSSFFENLKYGRVVKLSNICRNQFGDALCKFDVDSLNTTSQIASIAEDRLSIEIAGGGLTPQQYQDGTIVLPFAARTLVMDIAVNSDTTIYLWETLPDFFDVGDDITYRQGCLKTESACKSYNNFINAGLVPNGGNWSPSLLQSIIGGAN